MHHAGALFASGAVARSAAPAGAEARIASAAVNFRTRVLSMSFSRASLFSARMMSGIARAGIVAMVCSTGLASAPVHAQADLPSFNQSSEKAPPPLLALDSSLIVDALGTPFRGQATGGAAARLEGRGTLDGTRVGAPGLSAMLDMAAYVGPGLSKRLGDLQGVSSVAAPAMVRPINAWVQYLRGAAGLKAGIIDTNADFDEQNVGALFLNASFGMGPEFATSGLNGAGPSPYSALGAIAFWQDDARGLKLRVGGFGGRPGNPDAPRRWSWNLSPELGRLVIAELDWTQGRRRIAVGGWRNTAKLPRSDGRGDHPGVGGAFVTIEQPLL